MSSSLVTPPAAEPLTTDEAKLYCRIESDFTAEDTIIAGIIQSAREYAETFQARQLITATWKLKLHCFHYEIELPRPPLQSVTSITYIDPDGVTQTLSTSVYSVDTDCTPGVIRLKYGQMWPSVRGQNDPPIVVTFIAGYGATSSSVPARTKDGMGIYCDWRYRDRDGTRPMPPAVDSLLMGECWGQYA
ncbi:head-tail connector protein [Anatilimnocola floriformis]|uniref:head-tail connector protein n=1 Tax=Anatilimnocola floriformis TaxID=2948575 RepID=UPI0020C42FB4|nr:head-tail connector protein [Anatilimnocola floriformis]